MKEAVLLEWQQFQLAMRFLTSLPVSADLPRSDDLRIRANKFFPLVGAVLGGLGAVVFWASVLWLPPLAALLLAVLAVMIATGAQREEGLANTVDGVSRGAGRVQILELMAGPGLGLRGALAVGLSLTMKVTLLVAFSTSLVGFALILGQVLGMMSVVHVIATTPYAHRQGLAVAAPFITPQGYRYALMTTIGCLGVCSLVLGPLAVMVGLLCCILLAQGVRAVLMAKLRGYNSDCLGAVMIAGELGCYLGLSLWL